ncbi:MAG: hypothetical protein JJ885_02090 [Muricauda sp.]|nr:hypothetical protein [Allomuricauda sp.]MBO6587927.1 hypothetical protein [Allomuricauda sp.]MBO6617552.1 hypothetical protein [Allomuricauda sp.]MBO6643437.1 hypothetical protein [Allomuricauda sp.]MBO6745887.1 hypothetical protein [Allomuricauda sp.]
MLDTIKTLSRLFLCFLFSSCWPREMEETINLVINSDLDSRVDIKFFRNGLSSERKAISKTGPGEVFRDGDTDMGVQIHGIFQADSIELIFDNERLETHYLFTNEPAGNSLFDFDSYKRDGETYTYTIDTKNYNNATPCDGPCN